MSYLSMHIPQKLKQKIYIPLSDVLSKKHISHSLLEVIIQSFDDAAKTHMSM